MSQAVRAQTLACDQTPEQELIARILAGERKLFHDLVRPHERAVYALAFSVLRNHADTEEAAQETMVKALTRLDQLSSAEKFKSWLMQIAINEARLKRRQAHRHLFQPLELEGTEDDRPVPRDFAEWRDNPHEALERAEVREKVAKAMAGLPQMYREMFILRDVEQLSVTECSELLGISQQTVKIRLHRARLMLRERLAPVFKKTWLERMFPGKRRNPW